MTFGTNYSQPDKVILRRTGKILKTERESKVKRTFKIEF